MTSHTRRAVLATLTSVGLAGCTTSGDSEPPSEDELPDQCPTSLDLGVEWPRDIYTRSVGGFLSRYEAVAEFVTAYEEAYQVEKYAQSRFKSGDFSTRLDQDPEKVADGFHVTVSYSGSVYTEMTLDLEAFEVDSDGIPKDGSIDIDESTVPDDSEYISIDEIEDQRLQEVLKSAADSGYEEYITSSTDHYRQLIENFPPNASLNNGSLPRAYFDVNGTPVLLVIYPHGGSVADYPWRPVQYYVTEYVIRRTSEENESPRDGTVVECRLPD
ncbi:hypothetical protein [Halorubrum distributum]|uniref:hypothetical protein n=1 Tax=Halorubrum distributum TaxID=29283 RepID=UPI001267DAAF|nr:hypothetical protein [Halorubrum arcis]